MKSIKKYMSCVLIFSILLSVLSFNVQAASSVSASFDPTQMLVSVNANATGHTSIKTLPFDIDINSSAITDFADIEQLYVNSGRIENYIFRMPFSFENRYGKYTVYVNDGTTAYASFIYYNPAVAADIIRDTLNTKTTAPELDSAIYSDAASLGIDKTESFYLSNRNGAAEILVPNMMPFSGAADFDNKHAAALAMNAMKGADRAGTEQLLLNYEDKLGIEFSDYTALSDATKTDVCTLLSGMNFKSELSKLKEDGKAASFDNIMVRTIALSKVRTAKNWSDIKTIFTSTPVLTEIISANSSYNADKAGDVFLYLKKNGDFSSFASLKQSFNSAVTYANTPKTPTETHTPSTGPSISMPSGNVIPKDEYDDTSSGNVQAGTSVVPTSLSVPKLTGTVASFWDVSSSSWEHQAVSALGGNGIISGYTDGSFRSNNMITRAEYTKLICAAFNIKASPVNFSDVNSTDWFYPYVSVAAGAGIINGYDGLFNPDNNITREDAAVILYRLSALLGKEYSGMVNFGDISKVSLYALTAVRGLGNAGIIKGDSQSNFNPQNNLTRAEAAQLIYNFINAQVE